MTTMTSSVSSGVDGFTMMPMSVEDADADLHTTTMRATERRGMSSMDGDDDTDGTPTTSEKTERYALYACFLAIGMGTLFPWNVFITERPYFERRLRDASQGVAKNFEAAFANAYAGSNLIGVLACVRFGLVERLTSNRLRLAAPLAGIALCVWTCALATRASGWSGDAIFAQTMIVIIVVGATTALAQGGGFAVASDLPPVYAQAIMSGQAASGVAVSLVALITTAGAGGATTGGASATQAEVYFYVATFVLLACAAATLYMEKIPLYREYESVAAENAQREYANAETSALLGGTDTDGEEADDVESRETMNGDDASTRLAKSSRWFGHGEIRSYRLVVLVTFIATLSVFPSVTSAIESSHGALGELWSPTLFLLFNIGDLLGRHLATAYPKSPPSGAALLKTATLRFLFVPLLATCRVTIPGWRPPSLFTSDIFPIVFIFTLALSNGWIASLGMMYGPSVSPAPLRQREGVVLTLALVAGIFLGTLLSLVITALL